MAAIPETIGVRASACVRGHATERNRMSRTWWRDLGETPSTTGGRRRVTRCRSPSTAPTVVERSLASTFSARLPERVTAPRPATAMAAASSTKR